MDTVRRPLCGCFVLSCMVGGIVENPRAFGRCLPPARPEKAKPFQAGRSPCTKRPQTVRLRLHAPKKVFEGSKGRFFKNAPLAGSGTASHKERASQPSGCAFSGGTKSLHETPQIFRLRFHEPKKVFEGSKGRFFKNAPWQGVGRSPTKRERAQRGAPFQAGQRHAGEREGGNITLSAFHSALYRDLPQRNSSYGR